MFENTVFRVIHDVKQYIDLINFMNYVNHDKVYLQHFYVFIYECYQNNKGRLQKKAGWV